MHPADPLNEASFVALALANPVNAELIERLGGMGLPQCHLTAGCLFQAVWNRQAGRAPGWGVQDHDVFYFDGDDLSWEAEDRVIQAVQARTADLGVKVEVKNQARVHLWYRAASRPTTPRSPAPPTASTATSWPAPAWASTCAPGGCTRPTGWTSCSAACCA